MPNHTHSSDARTIVSKLFIAKLETNLITKIMRINENNRNANKNGNVKCISFVNDSATSMENAKLIDKTFPCCLLNIAFIGRHYLVKSTTHKSTLGGPSPPGEFEARKNGIKR